MVSPWNAALAPAVAFTIGAVLPLAAILLLPAGIRPPVTLVSVHVALVLTGVISSRVGGSPWTRPTLRIVIGGALALAATFLTLPAAALALSRSPPLTMDQAHTPEDVKTLIP